MSSVRCTEISWTKLVNLSRYWRCDENPYKKIVNKLTDLMRIKWMIKLNDLSAMILRDKNKMCIKIYKEITIV